LYLYRHCFARLESRKPSRLAARQSCQNTRVLHSPDESLHRRRSLRSPCTVGLPFQYAYGSRSAHGRDAVSAAISSSSGAQGRMFTSGHPQKDQSGNTMSTVVSSLQYRNSGGGAASDDLTTGMSSQLNMRSRSGTRPG
jgi:hypothetical protein